MKPNMGTCIDCHIKVNEGKKPWEDIAYSLPENTHGKEAKDGAHEKQESNDQKSQEIILKTIENQKKDGKLSMECSSCHQEIKTPDYHENAGWDKDHGELALKELGSMHELPSELKMEKNP